MKLILQISGLVVWVLLIVYFILRIILRRKRELDKSNTKIYQDELNRLEGLKDDSDRYFESHMNF